MVKRSIIFIYYFCNNVYIQYYVLHTYVYTHYLIWSGTASKCTIYIFVSCGETP